LATFDDELAPKGVPCIPHLQTEKFYQDIVEDPAKQVDKVLAIQHAMSHPAKRRKVVMSVADADILKDDDLKPKRIKHARKVPKHAEGPEEKKARVNRLEDDLAKLMDRGYLSESSAEEGTNTEVKVVAAGPAIAASARQVPAACPDTLRGEQQMPRSFRVGGARGQRPRVQGGGADDPSVSGSAQAKDKPKPPAASSTQKTKKVDPKTFKWGSHHFRHDAPSGTRGARYTVECQFHTDTSGTVQERCKKSRTYWNRKDEIKTIRWLKHWMNQALLHDDKKQHQDCTKEPGYPGPDALPSREEINTERLSLGDTDEEFNDDDKNDCSEEDGACDGGRPQPRRAQARSRMVESEGGPGGRLLIDDGSTEPSESTDSSEWD
jgi:hypothetical protein